MTKWLLPWATRLPWTLACTLSLLACSWSGSDPASQIQSTASLELTLDAGYELNPDEKGQASPLCLRIYELNASDLFRKADFLDLYDQDSATLQDSLVKVHRVPPQRPGQQTQLAIALDPGTAFIAVLAEFYHYQDADSRSIAPVLQNARNIGRLSLDNNRVLLSVSAKPSLLSRMKNKLPWSGTTMKVQPLEPPPVDLEPGVAK